MRDVSRHVTHSAAAVPLPLQTGARGEQPESSIAAGEVSTHGTQVSEAGSHAGAAPEQSEFVKHSGRHAKVAVSQTSVPGQSPSRRHS